MGGIPTETSDPILLIFFFQIILMILCWPCVIGKENHKTGDMIDQIAVATEKNDSVSAIASPLEDSTPVYYQNSNGFVPMINYDSSKSSQPNNSPPLIINETERPASSDFPAKWTNDAVFSTEARLLLSLPNSRSDRRSFSVQEAQKDFEILKVNKETPAIANYHEFYENLQKNLRTNGRDVWSKRNTTSTTRTRDRIKQIDEYFNHNLDHRKLNNHNRYPQNSNPPEDINQKPSIFEPEKVHNNYPQYAASNGPFSYMTPSKMPFASPDLITTNDRKNIVSKNYHQNSKPVVIPEPIDYKVESQYDFQQSSPDFSTRNPYTSQKYETTESENRYERKEDYSDGTSDYLEITERPRRVTKSRRRPYNSEGSRTPPNEHRDVEELKKTNSGRTRSRGRVKTNYWTDERDQRPEEPAEEHKNQPESPINPEVTDHRQNILNEPNGWSQVAPNVELSQSNGYEINQMDNTNLLVPINLNLVPLSNFNHVSNPGVSGMITATPLITSTASPLISTGSSMLLPKFSQNSLKNYGYPNAIPDVIVGQNTFSNPMQAVLLPQMTVQNKYSPNMKTQYLASTVSPMFTISQPLSPTVRGIHSTQTPNPTSPGNSYAPSLFLPQSTMQTYLQTPMNTGNYNIYVNQRGAPRDHEEQPTAPTSNTKYGEESADKRNRYQGSNGQILTSASYSVSQNGQTRGNIKANNIDTDTDNDHDRINDNNSENKYRSASPNNNGRGNSNKRPNPEIQENAYQVIRGAQVVPIIHTNGIAGVDLINQNYGQIHQAQSVAQPTYINQNNWRQLQQLQVHDANNKNGNRYQNIYGIDSLGSTTNNNANTANTIRNGYMEQAQLPVVGMQTVEIRNPNINIKPSPVDLTMVNPLEAINHYGAAVLTTPIPILSTTAGFLSPRPIITSTPESISIQGYVDSLTQIGTHNQQSNVFNPMNFIPNWDLIKSQTTLNKVHMPRPLPQHLSLVPIVPGGNFDKHSPTAQVELITKPKLSSDLEKYAEEMFKESLRTIYNTHKWNSDKKVRNLTDADIAELERLKSDLGRFKAAMTGKDILEAHHSETKFKAVEPGHGSKSTGLTAAAIEQLFKSDFKVNGPTENHSSQDGKPGRPREQIRLSDYLTPPKVSSHSSKYHDSPGKKRPKGSRYEGIKSRPHSKPKSRPLSPDTAARNHIVYSHRRPPHDRSHSHKGYKKTQKFDDLPTFTTSSPEIIKGFSDDKSYRSDYMDINHPRMHNLLGLLMKNKQLPRSGNLNYYNDDQEMKRDLEEERRLPEDFFFDDLGNFRKKSDALDLSHIPIN